MINICLLSVAVFYTLFFSFVAKARQHQTLIKGHQTNAESVHVEK